MFYSVILEDLTIIPLSID